MISISSREVDSPTKPQEGDASDGKLTNKVSSSSNTPWFRLKDPRIVRVSRALGGKDRHSKVCTIRGLRDRRVRLSVPTAIQLYDLQERLGLNQPSKVVDWLLNAAKSEIDELPPLPIPPGNFGLIDHHQIVGSSNEAGASQFDKEGGVKLDKGVDWEALPRPIMWSPEASFKAKAKEIVGDHSSDEKEKWMKRNDHEEGKHDQVSSSSFLSKLGHSSSSSLVNNAVPYGSFFHLEASNFPMSHLGSHGFASQTEDPQAHSSTLNEAHPLPSNLSLSSGSQFLVYPTGSTHSYLPSQVSTSMEIDPRQINHFQMLASTTHNLLPNSLTPSPYSLLGQSIRPFHFNVTSRFHGENEADKDQDFHAND